MNHHGICKVPEFLCRLSVVMFMFFQCLPPLNWYLYEVRGSHGSKDAIVSTYRRAGS
jgi:hypothetical protein